MKKIFKNRILIFVLGFISALGVGVVASTIFASNVTYDNTVSGLKDSNNQNVTTVQGAIDVLTSRSSDFANRNVCIYQSTGSYGNKGEVGAKYSCTVGNNITDTFYLLAIHGDKVVLIAEKNLSDTVGPNKMMTWYNAIEFFEPGQPGYATKQAWTNVLNIGLPAAQDIVDASLVLNPKANFTFTASTASATWRCLGSLEQDQPSGPLYCPSNQAQQKAAWLFSWTRGCESRGCSNQYSDTDGYPYGYWTKDVIMTDFTRGWGVNRCGNLNVGIVSSTDRYGVRPVITLLRTNLD